MKSDTGRNPPARKLIPTDCGKVCNGALWPAIGRLITLITPAEYVNMFAAAGYDPE